MHYRQRAMVSLTGERCAMKKRLRFNPRKVLVASAGVASISYLSTTGCATDPLVANLVASPGGFGGSYGGSSPNPGPGGSGGFGGSSLIANLVAPPPGGGGGSSVNEPLDASPDGTPSNVPDGSPDDGGLDSGTDSSTG